MAASRAKSKLFMSCDLVGSTSFKQTQRGWQKVFLSFYWEFPQFLVDADRAQTQLDNEKTSFSLWKGVGDELLFEVDVTTERQISRAVRVWLAAVGRYEDQVLADYKLALKGGAFIATFPGPDSESTIPISPEDEDSDEAVVVLNDKALTGQRRTRRYLYDYFGPSIDTGFRVIGRAERRYFTLSVEVAWAIALAAHAAAPDDANEKTHVVSDFVFKGSHILKGVWRAREYPLFAIDRECTDKVNEAVADMNGERLKAEQIIRVGTACASDEHWPFALYLPESTHARFQEKPEDVMADLLLSESTREGAETLVDDEGGESLEDSPPLG
ncbi:hypothetical protein ACQCSU_14515 [Pseudarthrobacter sp. O4]|uniref:hypothetical protein n=1 Tax=Pseudarthrobacter sp. O4 TaxID=3418417 RepID=UPI003CF6ABA2